MQKPGNWPKLGNSAAILLMDGIPFDVRFPPNHSPERLAVHPVAPTAAVGCDDGMGVFFTGTLVYQKFPFCEYIFYRSTSSPCYFIPLQAPSPVPSFACHKYSNFQSQSMYSFIYFSEILCTLRSRSENTTKRNVRFPARSFFCTYQTHGI